jgi:hypothetical protein
VKEIYGIGCRAEGASLQQIHQALTRTKEWLGVAPDADWTGELFQSANRYAHLYFLRESVGIEAYLVNLYFMNDPHWPHCPKSVQEWKPAIHEVKPRLGLTSPVPFSQEIFLAALP